MVSQILSHSSDEDDVAGHQNDRHLVFRKLGQFKTLSPAAYSAFQRCLLARVQTAGRNTPLIERGDGAGTVMIVLEGWAASCRAVKDSRPQIVALHLPGDFCDISIAFKRHMDCAVVALTDLRVASISRSALLKLATDHPEISQMLWWEAMWASATGGQWTARMARSSARARITHLLCELAVRLYVLGLADDTGFDVPMTQVDLANSCGLTSEHTYRIMSDLRRSNVASWEKGRLRLLDWDALREMAEFDPAYLQFRQLRRA